MPTLNQWSMVYRQIAIRHFGRKIVATLATKGIHFRGTTLIPGPDGSFANGEEAYNINDNGTGRVWTRQEVLEAAK